MAIWQFDFYLVNNMKEVDIEKNSTIIKNNYEKNEHWSEECLLFGNLDGTCFQLTKDEIFVRIDIRNLTIERLLTLDNTISKMDRNILYRNNIYRYNYSTLIKLIKESDSFKFCENPRLFLEDLKKQK